MRALVTGGAGFIGSHLVDRLLARGDDVTVIDNFEPDYPRAVKERNIAGHRSHPRWRLIDRDILLGDWAIALEGPYDVIVHLAAKAGVLPSIAAPERTYEVNVCGTINVLEAARQHARSTKVIFASSSSVYGGAHELTEFPSVETVTPNPISPYAASKLSGEQLCQLYTHLHGLSITALRFFTVYGPRQRPDLAIHKFARCLLDGRGVTLYGDGRTARDYTYIDDIVDGIVSAMERTPAGFEIVNLGSGAPVALRQMLTTVEQTIGRSARVSYYPNQVGDPPLTWANIDKAKALWDWSPSITFEDGVRRFVKWLADEAAEHAA